MRLSKHRKSALLLNFKIVHQKVSRKLDRDVFRRYIDICKCMEMLLTDERTRPFINTVVPSLWESLNFT